MSNNHKRTTRDKRIMHRATSTLQFRGRPSYLIISHQYSLDFDAPYPSVCHHEQGQSPGHLIYMLSFSRYSSKLSSKLSLPTPLPFHLPNGKSQQPVGLVQFTPTIPLSSFFPTLKARSRLLVYSAHTIRTRYRWPLKQPLLLF